MVDILYVYQARDLVCEKSKYLCLGCATKKRDESFFVDTEIKLMCKLAPSKDNNESKRSFHSSRLHGLMSAMGYYFTHKQISSLLLQIE